MHVELCLEVRHEKDTGLSKDPFGQGHVYEFGEMKKLFRNYLDTNFDHHLLLNKADPWAHALPVGDAAGSHTFLPGLQPFEGDPTTENIARNIAEWAAKQFGADARVLVNETDVNAYLATARWLPDQMKAQVMW
jgi:6-pyruvoyl-tetrahydropterin synthase